MGLMQSRTSVSPRKRVAIAGFDVEGQATYRYLSQSGQFDITILDERSVEVPDGVASQQGPEVFDQELDYDEIWRTPGLPPHRLKTNAVIKSGTIEFMERCPTPIIGVTGTKGKGTTASLAADILKASGKKVHLLGNIGRPALDELEKIKPGDFVVYELSSFQLWDVKKSPHIAVILMIEPEHLDRHSDLDDYVSAKANISRWQGPNDITIYHPSNKLSAQAAEPGMGKKIKYLSSSAADIRGDQLVIDEQVICSVSDFGLVGPHNHENIAAALSATWQLVQDAETAAKAIERFKGLPHRLQTVAVKSGVTYVDDSFATTPATAVAAAHSFTQPKIMIIGGSNKGSDYSQLADELKKTNVRKVLLIGQMGPTIKAEFDKAGLSDYEPVEGGMTDIVKKAAELANKGDVVLLSPACASFDMFKDYIDRAEQFKSAVEAL